MPFVCDLHIHSKYSRATSKDMDIENLAKWAKIKGISMMGTGDFTHPSWLSELEEKLKLCGEGIYGYSNIKFILTAEVSNIYFKAGRTRKVHNIILSPGFKEAKEVNRVLSEYGSLSGDGRPVVSIECDRMTRLLSAIDGNICIIPSHAWTPHFGIFGSKSGFDSPEECFEEELPKIYSIETGLSSDPAMNWRWSKLDRFCLTSHSDAHSPSKIGREANVFREELDYYQLVKALKEKDKSKFLYTIEFFPEEGKYHWDGHRNCKVSLAPREAMRNNNMCPNCGKKLTIGVMHRVESLADRQDDFVDVSSPSFKRAVPLAEIIADLLDVGPDSKTVEREYFKIIKNCGNEFEALLEIPEEELYQRCPEKIAKGIMAVRNGALKIEPGYDGEYGSVKIFKAADAARERQMSFF